MNTQLSINHTHILQTLRTETDLALVEHLRNGEIDAFEIIMKRHNQRLYRIARSILRDEQEALDVVQDTYVKAYYQINEFKGPDGFISWLSRIASNEALMKLRKFSRLEYSIDDPESNVDEQEALFALPFETVANIELKEMLEAAIDQLPVEYRSVYVLRAIQQLDTEEAANTLDLSTDVIKTRYLRARRMLQKAFFSHLEKAGLELFEFAGERCTNLVNNVLLRLKANES